MSTIQTRSKAARDAEPPTVTRPPTDSGLPTSSVLETPASPSATSALVNPNPVHERDDRSRPAKSTSSSTRSRTSLLARKMKIDLRIAQEKARIANDLLELQRQAEHAEAEAEADDEEARSEHDDASRGRVESWLQKAEAENKQARPSTFDEPYPSNADSRPRQQATGGPYERSVRPQTAAPNIDNESDITEPLSTIRNVQPNKYEHGERERRLRSVSPRSQADHATLKPSVPAANHQPGDFMFSHRHQMAHAEAATTGERVYGNRYTETQRQQNESKLMEAEIANETHRPPSHRDHRDYCCREDHRDDHRDDRRDDHRGGGHRDCSRERRRDRSREHCSHRRPSGWTPKMIDLPTFDGTKLLDYQVFRAAYRQTSEMHGFTDTENLARLRGALRGEAREEVRSYLYNTHDPEQIMRHLDLTYHRPEQLKDWEVNNLRNFKGGNLAKLASAIDNCVRTARIHGSPAVVYDDVIKKNVLQKLPPVLRTMWVYHAQRLGPMKAHLGAISEFLQEYVCAQREAGQPDDLLEPTLAPPRPTTATKQTTVAKSTPQPHPPRNRPMALATSDSCTLCNESHPAKHCKRLLKMTLPERWRWARDEKICFRCLVAKHSRRDCRATKCGVDGCDRPHHRLLHEAKQTKAAETDPQTDPQTTCSNNAATGSRAYLDYVPVTLSGPKGKIETYAMMDTGSTFTLLTAEAARRIGANGPTNVMALKTLAGVSSNPRSQNVTVELRGRNGAQFKIRARTIPELNLPVQTVSRQCIMKMQHLRHLASELCCESAEPTILIGKDNLDLLAPHEIVRGKRRGEPMAYRTDLGWMFCGATRNTGRAYLVASVNMAHEKDALHQEVQRHFELEAIGVTPRTKPRPQDARAERLLDELVRLKDGRYEAPLLWAEDEHRLPDNYTHALTRLKGVERKVDKDPQFKRAYTEEVNKLVEKGYAVKRPPKPDCSHRWFLPHFAVFNPNKPGKMRLVHDAAARARGVCLNDLLLTGPDLLRPLPGVLYRFREGKVALAGDIKEMFPQIKIRAEDQEAQLFLWRGEDRKREPDVYAMTSMVFGAASSPYTALYVKNRNATEHVETYPKAAKTIIDDHYMDDCLVSVPSTDEAKRLVRDITHVHAQAGFTIRGWTSNDAEVMSSIPVEARNDAAVELATDDSAAVKTLGLLWDPKPDTLGFAVHMHRVPRAVLDGRRVPTKREMLSALMSLYDPQGFAAPYVVRGRILLQQIWSSGIDWDTPLREAENLEWSAWAADLDMLKSISIPRCYSPSGSTPSAALHVFVDASEKAYCAVAYWRFTRDHGGAHVALIASKARVAPLKPTTVPRLELQAALLGVRLAESIANEHTQPISERVFWSDSTTALSWIRSDAGRYKPFVAHRIAEITDSSSANEWRWLPTRENVADDATRGSYGAFDSQHRWYTGPEFLRGPPNSWPTSDIASDTPEELKPTACIAALAMNEAPGAPHLPQAERFSSLSRLLRTTARVLLFIDTLRRTPETPRGVLQRRHMDGALRLWLQQAQRDDFAAEIKCLQENIRLPRTGKLAMFAVRLGSDGLIRVHGRTRRAEDIDDAAKSPVVLDGRHPVVRLLVRDYHIKHHHANNETVVNELRQRYHVLRLRPTVRTVARECQVCRIRRATPTTPIMGDLPSERLGSRLRPFTYSGLDYMGPLEVTIGRRHEKRYVALFTCLTVRAVHLELVHSLTTDSAIMSVRRFIARRGPPTTIITDNATCFRGAATELRRARAELDENVMADFALGRGFEWRFIPPSAPFMGGAWERLMRSVKTSLRATLNARASREEILLTLLAEAESVINSRPLTHVSVDIDDPEALTPNHFLLGTSSGAPTPGAFTDTDLLPRRAWRTSQRLADIFWQRWVREYLPTLLPRPAAGRDDADLAPGDVVLVVDPNMPRNVWVRGVVERTLPGDDGRVRVVDIRTKAGVLRRPVKRLVKIVSCVEEASPPPK